MIRIKLYTMQADLSKPKTLLPALRGVKVVFVVVPGHMERTALSIAGIKVHIYLLHSLMRIKTSL
jgi:uncharacterized protein YbjT (DUF2867 family)